MVSSKLQAFWNHPIGPKTSELLRFFLLFKCLMHALWNLDVLIITKDHKKKLLDFHVWVKVA